jgi:bifunctional non-homologous end joining protein LigD
VPNGPQWVHEIKHDGFRFICRLERGRVRVFSRRGTDYTERVPRIVDTLARLPAASVTIDGEGVACDPNGVTNFDLLRAALDRPARREVFLYAFDLLELDGRDVRREPWSDRRWRLARVLRGAGHGVQLSDHMEGNDGDAVFRHACEMGLEGIVAKRRDKPYRSGRSPDWVKVKNPAAPAATRWFLGWSELGRLPTSTSAAPRRQPNWRARALDSTAPTLTAVFPPTPPAS